MPTNAMDTLEPWTVLRGTIGPDQILAIAAEVAHRHRMSLDYDGAATLHLTGHGFRPAAVVCWKELPPQPPRTVGHQFPPIALHEVMIMPEAGAAGLAEDLRAALGAVTDAYTPAELDGIRAAMPLLQQYATPDPALNGWALLFRDHYLEHSIGFLLAMEHAGIPAEWIYALDKGDRTRGRDRVHATFLARGYRSGTLDNSAINDPERHAAELAPAEAEIDAFIDAAHAAGRRVLVVDDGGLLARGYGAAGAERRVDSALELTVSGIKRIAAASPPVAIPVLNMARSQIKTLLGYREIADSCVRALQTLLPDRKWIGRDILLLGYGTLGSRMAPALRSLGCRVTVVDTDLLTLITAAEAGYATHRTAADALTAGSPFVVIGTTGELALTDTDLALLPDDVFLAPFATRDFSALTEGHRRHGTPVPGVGIRYQLPDGRSVTLLGDGRSMNLFEADSIPNQGYDAYRAATLIAARHLCADPASLPTGLHRAPADQAIASAGLLDAYYRLYTQPRAISPSACAPALKQTVRGALPPAAIVGYGVAGRLHEKILNRLGANTVVIDPKHQDLSSPDHSVPSQVSELPPALASGIGLWSVCCPTADHLPVLKAIFAHNPAARVLLEKPACLGHEIDEFAELLQQHPYARVVVNSQYQHARTLPALAELVTRLEPAADISSIEITFTKDRTADIARGRFIDRDYGVLGYEWLHMLAILAQLLPSDVMEAYLASHPSHAQLEPSYDPRLFISALTERSTVRLPSQKTPTSLALTSSIVSSLAGRPAPATTRADRYEGPQSADPRYRRVNIQAGGSQFVLLLDPVTTDNGLRLDRNHHRLTATRTADGHIVHDEVLHDSPLETAVHQAVATLMANTPVPRPDLAPLGRIAALATALRQRTSQHSSAAPLPASGT